ncbi:MAG: hemerythrin domain-containing protein [Acidobacteria bacterium]|nr:hemerythrin domain-containing protein [Acidobacteriota bacterium]
MQRALAGDGSADNLERQRAVMLEMWNGEIRAHFVVEETVLFPALREYPGAAALLEELVAEHAEMRGLFARLEAEADAGVMERLCVVLAGHVRKEERVLFEKAQEWMTREQLDALGERLGVS